jgi:lipopolysaccharide export LptBFGC system permease protein LptF
VWSAATFAIVTAVLILLPFYGFDDRITGWYAAATLAPQAIPLAIPISVAFGLALGVRSRLTVSAAKIVLICAFAACLFSFATLAWVMPASNQAFRESIVRGESEPLKGYNEMSLAELRREAADSSRKRSGSARLYDHRFHFRFSLAAAALALVGFLLVVPVTNRGLRALMALGACVAYWALIYIGEGLAVYSPVAPKLAATIPASLGAWLPNIAFAIATMLLWACVHERTASRLNV